MQKTKNDGGENLPQKVRPKAVRITLEEARGATSARRKEGAQKTAARRVSEPAYSYIYDTFIQEMKYLKLLRELENRLVDLGIGGRVHRLSCFKNLQEIIKDDVVREVKTVVIVGNDESFIRAIDALGETGVVAGFIPIGGEKENQLAKIFGIGFGAVACDVLSARLLRKIDLGVVNGHHFLTNIDIPAANFFLECDGRYNLSFLKSADVRICNLTGQAESGERAIRVLNHSDGFLETIVYSKSRGFLDGVKEIFKKEEGVEKLSIFYNKKVNVVGSAPFVAWIDGRKVFNKKLEISILPGGLKMIVGRSRTI
jgi:diacylglycerol kinase family enzyme